MASHETQLELERARVRDLLKYYKPNVNLHHPSASDNAVGAEPSTMARPVGDVVAASKNRPPDAQLLSHDPTLTAFAQLGALRLNCERSFISLMDQSNQYVLAEATRSVSLTSQDVYDQGDEVYLGARVIDIAWGVCPNAIKVFTAKDDRWNVSTAGIVANQDCYVMNDMSTIDSFKDRPYVAEWPYFRFYAEVPIHSPTGHIIGTFCVVDNKPREGLDRKGLHALNEISSAIMKHLELVHMQQNLQRAGGMVKGLGEFLESKRDLQGSAGRQIHIGEVLPRRPPLSQTDSTSQASSSDPKASTQPTSLFTGSISSRERYQEGAADNQSVHDPSQANIASETKVRPSQERELLLGVASADRELAASTANKQLFSRASHLIQVALDLDGVMFVDARFRDIAINPANPILLPPSPTSSTYRGTPETPAGDRSGWLDGVERTIGVLHGVSANPGLTNKQSQLGGRSKSDVLGYSIRSASDVGDTYSPIAQVALPQSALRGLLAKYPQGHTFVFDEDGLVVELDSDSYQPAMEGIVSDGTKNADSGNDAEKTWIGHLASVCPGAKSITFIPLWDLQRNQWFAGGLAWTKDPTRIIDTADTTYLTAFGSCVMAEKSRLDTVTADRAKLDFISSVSHELRSPLHGILASAEALQESMITSTQEEMIQTVVGCGETLLDTVDQILDYTKTNQSGFIPEARIKNDEVPPGTITTLDFANLVETAVEAIVAGQDYERPNFGSLSIAERSQIPSAASNASGSRIMIVLGLDWWTPRISKLQSISWKRIVMNLVGNALKYTRSGFVHVSLVAETAKSTLELSTQQHITLQIQDSGRGISSDYLKNNLFTPFAQEDQLSPGTGLGLSIVRQLVANLGGTIDVQSVVGYGTTVNVTVPIHDYSHDRDLGLSDLNLLIDSSRARCKGVKLCLVGFEYYPDIGEEPTGILSAYARFLMALKSALTKMATDWFQMEVVTASSVRDVQGCVLIGLRSKWDQLELYAGKYPMILVEDTAEERPRDHEGVFSIPQIIGPQKLARLLALCLDCRLFRTNSPRAGRSTDTKVALELSDPQQISGHSFMSAKLESTPKVERTQSEDFLSNNAPLLDLNSQESIFSASNVVLRGVQSSSIPQQLHVTRSKVLLVEDNIINMKILINYMKKIEQDYVTAANGLEALQIFQAHPLLFKVVFMDISMPVMDGFTSTRRMREHERENAIARTRIVALTCFSSSAHQQKAVLNGFDKYLIKPVPMKSLKPILEMDADIFIKD